MPCFGWRARINASAPQTVSDGSAIFGWYQNSSQFLSSASARSTLTSWPACFAAGAARCSSAAAIQPAFQIGRAKRLAQRRQHRQPVRFADLLDFLQRVFIAPADQQHAARVVQIFELVDDLDGVGLAQRQIQNDQFGED